MQPERAFLSHLSSGVTLWSTDCAADGRALHHSLICRLLGGDSRTMWWLQNGECLNASAWKQKIAFTLVSWLRTFRPRTQTLPFWPHSTHLMTPLGSGMSVKTVFISRQTVCSAWLASLSSLTMEEQELTAVCGNYLCPLLPGGLSVHVRAACCVVVYFEGHPRETSPWASSNGECTDRHPWVYVSVCV